MKVKNKGKENGWIKWIDWIWVVVLYNKWKINLNNNEK
jgi:hypothetical protein